MSNQQVGAVFEKVIQEVCDASQVDFEESGVDQQTLHDLRDAWQKKLSSVNVAHFPWDPAPPQPSQNVLPPSATVPSNAPRPPPQPQYVPTPVSMPQSAPMPVQMPPHMTAPRIKTEPGSNGQPMPHMAPQMPPHMNNPQSARDRAASHLQQKYGTAAANSVSQMQAQAQAGQGYPQMHPAAHGQMPPIKTEHGYPPMGPGQTDGAGDEALIDWKAEVARRRAAAADGEGDRLLREHLKQRMSQFEGGGLLRPLNEHESSAKLAYREALTAPLNEASGSSSSAPRISGQFDGADGEVKEEDEDAINSDLDDPDDLVADDHDQDESEGQVMLCTYDKVQRVKNKWKCTLKDGILTTGGKEYVFHKGQGEFEW